MVICVKPPFQMLVGISNLTKASGDNAPTHDAPNNYSPGDDASGDDAASDDAPSNHTPFNDAISDDPSGDHAHVFNAPKSPFSIKMIPFP